MSGVVHAEFVAVRVVHYHPMASVRRPRVLDPKGANALESRDLAVAVGRFDIEVHAVPTVLRLSHPCRRSFGCSPLVDKHGVASRAVEDGLAGMLVLRRHRAVHEGGWTVEAILPASSASSAPLAVSSTEARHYCETTCGTLRDRVPTLGAVPELAFDPG